MALNGVHLTADMNANTNTAAVALRDTRTSSDLYAVCSVTVYGVGTVDDIGVVMWATDKTSDAHGAGDHSQRNVMAG
jgi:hypothetical protein